MIGTGKSADVTLLPKPTGEKKNGRKMGYIHTGKLDSVPDSRGTVASNFSFLTPR